MKIDKVAKHVLEYGAVTIKEIFTGEYIVRDKFHNENGFLLIDSTVCGSIVKLFENAAESERKRLYACSLNDILKMTWKSVA